jgi:hypothetical protein
MWKVSPPFVVIFAWLILLSVAEGASARLHDELQIYFTDGEGGQSTLVIMPDHQFLLIDAGSPSDGGWESAPGDSKLARDANRILRAAQDAGITRAWLRNEGEAR